MTITEQLAQYAVDLSYGDIDRETTDFVKTLLLDIIGDALGGVGEEDAQRLAKTVAALDRTRQATIWGTSRKASVPWAAFANTAAAEANDFTPGSTGIIPAAIAVGESTGASGRVVLEAIIAGYEVSKRIGDAFDDVSLHKNGFYWPYLSPSCAVAAGKVLGLDKEQMANALGIAGSMGTPTWHPIAEGFRTKLVFHGIAAVNGILASHLAAGGVGGPRKLFEGSKYPSIAEMFSKPSFDISVITRELGQPKIREAVLLKMYPSCRASHSSIDCALEAAKTYEVRSEEIERITVEISDRDKSLVGRPISEVKGKTEAQFSVAYLVAAVLLQGRPPALDFFSDEMLADSTIRDLAGRVEIVGSEELQRIRTYPHPPYIHPARLTIETRSGKQYKVAKDYFKGSPHNPATEDEAMYKFKAQSQLGGHVNAEAVLKAVRGLDKAPTIEGLTKELGARKEVR